MTEWVMFLHVLFLSPFPSWMSLGLGRVWHCSWKQQNPGPQRPPEEQHPSILLICWLQPSIPADGISADWLKLLSRKTMIFFLETYFFLKRKSRTLGQDEDMKVSVYTAPHLRTYKQKCIPCSSVVTKNIWAGNVWHGTHDACMTSLYSSSHFEVKQTVLLCWWMQHSRKWCHYSIW